MAGRAYSVLRDRTVCGNAPQDRWVFVLRFTAFRIHIGIEAHSGRFSGPFDKSAPARFRSGTKARISAFGWDDLPTMREAHEAHHPYVSLCAVPADRHHLYDHPDVQAVPAAGLVVDREMRKKGAISFKSAQDRKMIVRRISAWLGLKGVTRSSEELRQVSPSLDLDKFARSLYSGDVADLKQIGRECGFSDLARVWRQMLETIEPNFH
jgi:hypothetical protein